MRVATRVAETGVRLVLLVVDGGGEYVAAERHLAAGKNPQIEAALDELDAVALALDEQRAQVAEIRSRISHGASIESLDRD
jgi:hypothetical protein